jgi:PAS domain S-box-containing protein
MNSKHRLYQTERFAVALLAVFFLLPHAAVAQMKEVRRVLIFNDLSTLASPGFALMDQAIHARLQESPYQIELYNESLESTLFSDEVSQRQMSDWYIHKYEKRQPDVIIAVGTASLKFMIASHERYFPKVPIIYCGGTEEMLGESKLDSHFTGAWGVAEPEKTLDLALRLQPGTRHLVVTGGVGQFDRDVEAIARKSFSKYESTLEITYLTDLAMPALLDRLRNLPSDTVVFHTSIMQDAAGNRFIDATQSVPLVAAAANGPVFVLDDVDVGNGAVGGNVLSWAAQGREAAGMAVRILNGENPRDIPATKITNSILIDWRALQRWGLNERILPPGSIVQFRESTVWERYKWQIVAALSICLLEAFLILALIANLIQRHRAERSLGESTNRLGAILGTASEGILTFNDCGIIESTNAAARNIFGYTADEMFGRNVAMVLPAVFSTAGKEGGPIAGQTVSPIIASGIQETSGRRKDGSMLPIDLAVNEVVLADRRIFTGFVRDITERRQIQQMQREFSKQLLQAHETERARLARELHDDITQRLGILAMNADRLDSEDDLIAKRETLRGIRDGLIVLSEDVHSLAYKLHPALLEHLGLAAALRTECERFSRQESISVDVKLEGLPADIPQEARLCLFRVAQEALRNVARHAHAQAVQVSLHSADGGLELEVADNGAGFIPGEELQQASLGLASMRERVRLLEGKLQIKSGLGHGTVILAWIPIKTYGLPDTTNMGSAESAVTNGVEADTISVKGKS